jgi:glycosyltransferase involved in cell wall biosynthesis
MKLVSVCIPTYEQPQLALRAVESALIQRNCNFEIIVSDDSRDNSVWAALAPVLKDNRIRYYHNADRKGAVSNWNHAINRASGQIYKILHHDDWFEGADALARYCEPILNGDAKVVFSACNAVSTINETRLIHKASKEQISALKNDANEILFGNFLGAPSVFAAEASLCSRFDPTYLWVSDMEFYARLIAEAQGQFEYIESPLVNISTDLPSQISRLFEHDHGSAFIEYARAFGSLHSAKEKKRARDFLADFVKHIPHKQRYSLVINAFRASSFRVGMSLIKAIKP